MDKFTMFKALIVEDNPAFRQLLCAILRARFPGMLIAEAADGPLALETVEFLLPDIIFMDIKLPGANGLELTQRIKKGHPTIPIIIIILTSHDLPEYREAAFQAGADYFIAKAALNEEELVVLIESILSGPAPSVGG